MNKDTQLVVTRHPGLVEFLEKEGIIKKNCQVLRHVIARDVEGKHVIGVLPAWLAVHALSVTEVEMDLPDELRGKELSVEEIDEHVTRIWTYRVEEL